MKPLLLIRADASATIGTGHVMRCLALAQAWIERGGAVKFAMKSDANLGDRLTADQCGQLHIWSEPGSPDDCEELLTMARDEKAAWIAVDGYQFDSSYQETIKAAGFRLLFIDDYGHGSPYAADVVLNQNSYAGGQVELYKKKRNATQVLLGCEFALLRREFRSATPRRDPPDTVKRLLVSLGGTDVMNVTGTVLGAVKLLKEENVTGTVVIGAGNAHRPVIEAAAEALGWDVAVNATNMPELMAKSDLAICGGGSTNYELAYMGLPALIIILAENQRPIAEDLESRKIVKNFGWFPTETSPYETNIPHKKIANALRLLIDNPKGRLQMHQNGRALVDGKGAVRVADALSSAL